MGKKELYNRDNARYQCRLSMPESNKTARVQNFSLLVSYALCDLGRHVILISIGLSACLN